MRQLIIAYLLLLSFPGFAKDPGWMEQLRSGNYQYVVETVHTILFRNIANCATIIAETETMIKKAYPNKLQLPYKIEVFHQSERGDCGVTLSIKKADIMDSENAPPGYLKVLSNRIRVEKIVKLLEKGMNINEIRAILSDLEIKKDERGFINLAKAEKLCYSEFGNNAGFYIYNRYLICMSGFNWNSLIMGIYDSINNSWSSR